MKNDGNVLVTSSFNVTVGRFGTFFFHIVLQCITIRCDLLTLSQTLKEQTRSLPIDEIEGHAALLFSERKMKRQAGERPGIAAPLEKGFIKEAVRESLVDRNKPIISFTCHGESSDKPCTIVYWPSTQEIGENFIHQLNETRGRTLRFTVNLLISFSFSPVAKRS